MLSESDKHAAALAVSRYGVDSARVQQACQAHLQARAEGKAADLLSEFVHRQILTAQQADDLRNALGTTHLDTNRAGSNGKHPTDAVNVVPAGSVFELRRLGEYRILRRLGEGGMGSVFLAYDERQNRHVALKVLPEHLAGNQGYVDRFYREAKSGFALDHPNIVRGLAVGQDKATHKHYLVLEYVDGPSAHALLNQFGMLRVGDASHIALDIARALEHAHSRNIIHRDIKPDNILLTLSGVAKLADLGLAKRTDEASHLTAARQGFGTPYYMPYEQAMNAKYADGRSDIYALGATLYHLVVGEPPFTATSHLDIVEKKKVGKFTPAGRRVEGVPAALDRILHKMLAQDPFDRYQTASEVIIDLERSRLAAAVPSFIDPDKALQDPLVRARLSTPAQPTRPDLETPPAEKDEAPADPDVWFLRYRNREGRPIKTRRTTAEVVERLKDGRLIAGGVEAAHQPQGEFRPLASYLEFRDVAAPARRKNAGPSRPADKPPVDGDGHAAPDDDRSRRWWWPFGSVL
jgi:eukaryotic-like serine/threonine-protein kinase